jgi:hypothetical protein
LLREQPRYADLVSAYDVAEQRRRAERASAEADRADDDIDDAGIDGPVDVEEVTR